MKTITVNKICVYDNGTLVIDFVDNSVIPAASFYKQTWFIPSMATIASVAIITVVLLMRRK